MGNGPAGIITELPRQGQRTMPIRPAGRSGAVGPGRREGSGLQARGRGALETKDLKKAGLKVTVPRMKILEILERNKERHLSAEDVYKILLDAGEEIGIATVYRVLTQFEAADLVNRHNFEGNQAVFELNLGHHHDHILCVRCGRVDEFVDETIENRQQEIAREKGYRMTDHSLYIYGVCPDCISSEKG